MYLCTAVLGFYLFLPNTDFFLMYSFIIFETDLTALLRLALAFWAQTSSCMILISRWDLQACAFPSPHLDDGFC